MTTKQLGDKELRRVSFYADAEQSALETSSNHRLESAGLNALEELLFKMLGMVGDDI